MIFERLQHLLLQLKGRPTFGKKVGVLGNFTVLDPKNVSIGDFYGINHRVFIVGQHLIEISSHVVLLARYMLIHAGLDKAEFMTQDFPKNVSAPIKIEDGAWVGAEGNHSCWRNGWSEIDHRSQSGRDPRCAVTYHCRRKPSQDHRTDRCLIRFRSSSPPKSSSPIPSKRCARSKSRSTTGAFRSSRLKILLWIDEMSNLGQVHD